MGFFLVVCVLACGCVFCCVFFFFQAEDGIRDHCVTGVQTCALPISYGGRIRCGEVSDSSGCLLLRKPKIKFLGFRRSRQIGRASCRERV